MSDTFGPSFFFANDPNISADMRKRIALQMLMSNKRAFPKTFGEGLASIGDSIGDMIAMRRLGEIDAAENKAGDAAVQKYMTPGGPQTYAPPDSVPPAVAAINRAAGPAIAPAQPPPPPRVIVPPPQAPGGGAAPVAGTGPQGDMVNPEDYNEIDAADPRNRYRPPPAYLAPALERNIADPERRAYLGQLAGKEARSANEVSPTGAAGPFQFTRGTGAQYGIPGNARFDPDASTLAVNRFTDDNVKALTARLGREPTPSEMALAHQQGAGTAGNMLTGAGNASANNLAVNNVPPGMGPQAAAQRVMNYYAMPGAGPAGAASPRDAVASTMVAQQQPPDGRPTVGDYGQRLALAATPPDAGIQAAPPPATPPIRQAPPPQQVAQAQPPAQPQAVPGYVPEVGPEPTPPPTMTPVQQNMLRDIQATPPSQREAVQRALKPLWDQEQAKIAQAHEIYKDKLTQHRERVKLVEEKKADQAERIARVKKTEQEIADAQKPKVQKLEGDEYERNPQTGVYEPVRTSANPDRAPALPKNEFQLKSLKHYEQMQEAEKNIGEGKALRSGASATGSQVPIIGGYLQSDAYRKERAAAERWVINKLRQESGATIGEKELDREVKAYFPQPSDDAKTAADKNAARKIATEGMMEASGREGKAFIEWKNKRAAAEEAAKAKEVAEAVQWLKDNPKDPNAAAVRRRLGL